MCLLSISCGESADTSGSSYCDSSTSGDVDSFLREGGGGGFHCGGGPLISVDDGGGGQLGGGILRKSEKQ